MKKEIKIVVIFLCAISLLNLMGCVQDIECAGGSANNFEGLPQKKLVEYVSNYGQRNNETSNAIDTRCVDIKLSDLQNYLCTIENSELAGEVTKLRFYLIKYPNEKGDGDTYEERENGKVSIAVIPLIVEEGTETEMPLLDDDTRMILNHGHSIPPMSTPTLDAANPQ